MEERRKNRDAFFKVAMAIGLALANLWLLQIQSELAERKMKDVLRDQERKIILRESLKPNPTPMKAAIRKNKDAIQEDEKPF